jgi:anti-anti-sigma factor
MAGDSAFEARCERRDTAAVVTVRGELDLNSADALSKVLQSPDAQAPTVVLDLRTVSFIDSSGLSVIVGQHRRSSAAGTRFLVAVGGAQAVQRLFELTGLAGVITLVADPDVALGGD